MRDPSAEHGVVAHDGHLWWLALAYGLSSCDPLGIEPLRFLPLPGDCEMGDDVALKPTTGTLVKQHRCVDASEGNLHFVEVRGLSYDAPAADDILEAEPMVKMWTLVASEDPNPWKLEYVAPFADIWEEKTYGEAGLPRRKVPHIAFVDPDVDINYMGCYVHVIHVFFLFLGFHFLCHKFLASLISVDVDINCLV